MKPLPLFSSSVDRAIGITIAQALGCILAGITMALTAWGLGLFLPDSNTEELIKLRNEVVEIRKQSLLMYAEQTAKATEELVRLHNEIAEMRKQMAEDKPLIKPISFQQPAQNLPSYQAPSQNTPTYQVPSQNTPNQQ